ncbi:MAG: hypothetical protein WD557_16175 [Dehalococcoidia bacterium]
MMNDEQSKRLSDAADALIQAADALNEARESLSDRRFESEQERERTVAAQQMSSRLDAAGKRIEDALRKAVVASAASTRAGAWGAYREATMAVREGRGLARGASDADGSAQKRTRGEESWTRLNEALEATASLIFPE